MPPPLVAARKFSPLSNNELTAWLTVPVVLSIMKPSLYRAQLQLPDGETSTPTSVPANNLLSREVRKGTEAKCANCRLLHSIPQANETQLAPLSDETYVPPAVVPA